MNSDNCQYNTMERSNIVPLNESNFPTWKIQLKMYLISQDLFGVVNETEVAPADTTTAEYSRYAKKRDKALAAIVLAIEPRLLYIIGEPQEPSEVWKKLTNTFQRKSWANKLRLRRKLYNLKLKEGDNMQDHLKIFVDIFSELAVVGDKVEEEDQVINVLASLPDSYSTLVTALEAMDKVPSWEVVTERLLHEEQKSANKQDSTCSAMVSQHNSSKMKKTIKCYNCGKVGHYKKNCRVPIDKTKRNYRSDAKFVNVETTQERNITMFASAFSCNSSKSSWIIDSGASQHMCTDRNLFSEISNLPNGIPVEVGDGRNLIAESIGKVILENNGKRCFLEKVLYVPSLSHNLLSVSRVAESGKVVEFDDRKCKILSGDKSCELISGTKKGLLYLLDTEIHPEFESDTALFTSHTSNYDIWHRRFCHLGKDNLKKLLNKKMVTGIDGDFSVQEPEICENCCDGKNHRSPLKSSDSKLQRRPFELVHSDVCGKIDPTSLGGANYFLTFIDDCTRYTWVYFLKKKSDVFEKFKQWKLMVENQFDKKVKTLRTDNGGEYCSTEFSHFLQQNGIRHETTVPKTPEQNGVAERANRTLVEAVRAMLSDSKLPKHFWAEALLTAVYVKNRSPTVAILDKTPFEALIKRKPSVKHLRTFGCICYSHVPKDERHKLDSKSRRCVFMGYNQEGKSYRVYDLVNKKTIISRDVIFSEGERVSSEKESKVSREGSTMNFPLDSDDVSTTDRERQESQLRRSTRERKEPERYGEWAYSSMTESGEPSTFKQAQKSADHEHWSRAMQGEIDSINESEVWTLVKPPVGVTPVGCKWVFKRKLENDGSLGSYKARLVAQGFSQKAGEDFDETFSPVARFESIRTVLSMAIQRNLKLHQMDVTAAFLNGKLDEDIYMQQPPGFVVEGKEDYVYKLNRSLYGLKQSPRCWNDSLDSFLKQLGFVASKSDSCIYTRVSNGLLCIVAVYVDDFIIASSCDTEISKLKLDLSERYKMKDLGLLRNFLGVSIVQDENSIFIHQTDFVKSLLRKFEFDNAKPVKTPVDVSIKLQKADDNSEPFDVEKYQSAVGSILYLSTRTRPDLTFAANNVARYSSNPTQQHWIAVKRIFRYLVGTVNFGLHYSKQDSLNCVGYSDSDWAGDINDRKSTSGYCFTMSGALISWRTSKQSCVALSTAEAEYVALAAASQEAIWFKQLFADLHCTEIARSPMIINEDNQACMSIAKNPVSHSKTIHIDIKVHFIREQITSNKIVLKYCPTDIMMADIFTKGLTSDKFINLRSMIGMKASS